MAFKPSLVHLLKRNTSAPPSTSNSNLATFISLVANTPFTAIYALLVLIFSWPTAFDPLSVWGGFLLAFIFLLVIPLSPIVYSILTGHTDLFVSDQTKRGPLFTIAIISQLIGAVLALIFGSIVLTLFHLCYATTTFTTAMINTQTKLSVHIAGIAGPVTFLVYILGPIHILWFLTIVPVAWSRLELKAHTPLQLMLGFITAVFITAGTLALVSPVFYS